MPVTERPTSSSECYIGGYVLEHGYRQYRSGEANIIAEAVRLADDDFDFAGYQYVMIVAPSSHFSRGYARGRVDTNEGQVARTVVVNSVYKSNRNLWAWGNLAAHELAHGLGLTDLYPFGSAHQRPDPPEGRVWVGAWFGIMFMPVSFLADPPRPTPRPYVAIS